MEPLTESQKYWRDVAIREARVAKIEFSTQWNRITTLKHSVEQVKGVGNMNWVWAGQLREMADALSRYGLELNNLDSNLRNLT